MDSEKELSQQTEDVTEDQRDESAVEKPDAVKVLIQRRGDEVATCISYEDGSGQYQHWRSDPTEQTFEVSVIIAHAAVQSGHFEVHPDSRTKLKL